MREEIDYDLVTHRLVPGMELVLGHTERHVKLQEFKAELKDLIDIASAGDNSLVPGLEFSMYRANQYLKLKDFKLEMAAAIKLAKCQEDPPEVSQGQA